MKKVVKFGGSSLASPKQFKKAGEIIRSDKPDGMWFRQRRENAMTKMRR